MKQTTKVCLMFNTKALDAAKFYCSVFKNSKITGISYYGKGMHMPEGTVLTVSFKLNGQEYICLNSGAAPKFTEAISFAVTCDTQKEIDYYWNKLTKGGKIVECGWLTDKFGLSWQIFPTFVKKIIEGRDLAKRDRVMAVVMQMKKPNIAKLKAAAKGIH